jgi:GMP synthase (glutamine-hydrolysing)
VQQFMTALHGVTEPEQKRRIIGELFIRTLMTRRANWVPSFLVQGTIYPDVVESSAPDRAKAQRIKTHHNVGGLPDEMQFELVEPLRYLFKDEVRLVGEALGLPAELVWRQPFPGPGLAVRCLGEVTPERLDRLRQADAIFTEELAAAGLLRSFSSSTESSQLLID